MLTTDFSGTYDYEREEARAEAEALLEWFEQDGRDYYQQQVIKARAHWAKILTPEGMRDFADEFNRLTAEKTGIYM